MHLRIGSHQLLLLSTKQLFPFLPPPKCPRARHRHRQWPPSSSSRFSRAAHGPSGRTAAMSPRSGTPACGATASAWHGRRGTSATRSARRPPAWAAPAVPIASIFSVRPFHLFLSSFAGVVEWVATKIRFLRKRGSLFRSAETSSDEEGRPVYSVAHLVSDADNRLGAGDPFPGSPPGAARVTDADLYAPAKELYLGDRCQVADTPAPWQFWMVMLKNGNLDTTAAACPENGRPARPFPQTSRFPCPAGAGCMNQPLLFHNRTALDDAGRRLRGGLFGTYDLDAAAGLGAGDVSFYSVTWEKDVAASGRGGGWAFHHKLCTSTKYPWLMLYLRSDATRGFSGGYHYDTRGMTKTVSSGHFL
jgi:hypothetical protein